MDKEEFERKIAAYGRDPKAQAYEIAGHYLEGDVEGVGKDSDLALAWYRRVIEAPDEVPHYFDYPALALFQIGRIYFERGEYETAVQYLTESTEEPSDQVSLLGRCYLFGLGVPQDLKRGEERLENGKGASVAYLAGLYERGELFEKDAARAAALYSKAFRMAVRNDSDEEFAALFPKVEEAAEGGNAEAQLALGAYFLSEPYSFASGAIAKGQYNWASGAYWMLRAKEHGGEAADLAEKALETFTEAGYEAGTAERAAAVYAHEREQRGGPDARVCAQVEAYLRQLGPRYLRFYDEAVARAAECGNAYAEYALARNESADTVKWIELLRRAARQGHGDALAQLQERGIPLEDPPIGIPPEGELPAEVQEELWCRGTVLVGGNRRIKRICFSSGYRGSGGSNNSPYTDAGSSSVRPAELEGKPPYEVFGMRLTAVVNDIAYFVRGKEILNVSFGHGYTKTYGVAYDTYQTDSIYLSDEE